MIHLVWYQLFFKKMGGGPWNCEEFNLALKQFLNYFTEQVKFLWRYLFVFDLD